MLLWILMFCISVICRQLLFCKPLEQTRSRKHSKGKLVFFTNSQYRMIKSPESCQSQNKTFVHLLWVLPCFSSLQMELPLICVPSYISFWVLSLFPRLPPCVSLYDRNIFPPSRCVAWISAVSSPLEARRQGEETAEIGLATIIPENRLKSIRIISKKVLKISFLFLKI